ncbi:S8 family serine peptidase [Alkalimonas delamerensis]|uniref:S8 family serine peptidase n=1 Tax=Alkalimonas delamerensis TaxID=265981 RepID=A0ABT9GN59_9GAMM|nr:S8 family serine peptidase [Alkalimonas delamerensis]MDP4528412.1 S8 family serine peptidase [Alkalimonas delamerensis]
MKTIKATKLALAVASTFTLSALSTQACANDLNGFQGLASSDREVSLRHGVPSLRPDTNKSQRYIIKFKAAELMAHAGLPMAADFERLSEAEAFSVQAAESVLAQHQADAIMHLDFVQASVAELKPQQLRELAKHPAVEYIELDHKRYISDVISPMAQTTPYGITMVQANQVSDANATNMNVCVIDTGYQYGHSDLPTSGVTGSSFSGHGSWWTDGNGHGTHVAGTIVALNNNIGVVGVLPSGLVGLHNVKIFNDSGNWTHASNLIQAIQSCQNAGSKVVNMSLGGGSSNTTERNAMTNFFNNGMLLVAAAGNAGNTSFSYPASYDAVVSVAAVDSNKNLANFSQRNSQVEISGPGVNVASTWNNGGYRSISGTSMASPHVAGVAALVWSNHPQCTNAQIRNVLNQTAERRGTSGRNNNYGWGIVRAKVAHDWITNNGCDGNGGGNPGGGQTFHNLSGSAGQWLRGSYDIPSGVSQLTFRITGGTGDADLYIRRGAAPTEQQWDCRPYRNGNEEVCTFNNPQAGTWHVGIRGYTAFSGVTFSYQY